MDKLEELQKAIEVAAEHGMVLIKKSQMAFDFSAPNPHHVAYTRTNASGTVSNIAAKGAPHPQAHKVGDKVIIGHDLQHEAAGKEGTITKVHAGGGIGASGVADYTVEVPGHGREVYGHGEIHKTESKPALKPNATTKHEHYHWGRLTKVDGKGISAILHPEHQEAVGKLQDGDSTRFKDEQDIEYGHQRGDAPTKTKSKYQHDDWSW